MTKSHMFKVVAASEADNGFAWRLVHTTGKTAADKRKSDKTEVRQLDDAPPYDKEKIVHVKSLIKAIGMSLEGLHEAVRELSSVKSHVISPDGKLGGRGYVMSIKDFKDTLSSSMNSVSNLMDTIADELTNPSWELSKEDIDTILNDSGASKGFGDDSGDDTQDFSVPPEGLPAADTDALLEEGADEAPSANEEAPADEATLDGLQDMQESAESSANPKSSIPYEKLAHFPGNPSLDPVANALRAKILFNMFDRRAK